MTALSRKFWQDYLPDRIVFLLFFLVIFVSLPQPVLHLDVPSLILVVATTLIVAEILFWASGFPFSETMMILGMPLGLVGSAIGLVLVFGTSPLDQGNLSIEAMGTITRIMLLTVMYGVILCVLGYLLRKQQAKSAVALPIGIATLYSSLLIIILPVAVAMLSSQNIGVFYSPAPLFLSSGLVFLSFLARENGRGPAERIADASLAIIILGILISVVELYGSFGENQFNAFIEPQLFFNTANFANYGMLYGATLYIFSFLLSLRTGEIYGINFKLRNWHMLEAFSFYVFMTLAAPSLFSLV